MEQTKREEGPGEAGRAAQTHAREGDIDALPNRERTTNSADELGTESTARSPAPLSNLHASRHAVSGGQPPRPYLK